MVQSWGLSYFAAYTGLMPRPTLPYRTTALRRFGGLYTEADPRNLPPGASPQCQDCDFTTGQVFQRPGITSVASAFNTSQPGNGFTGLGQALVGSGSLLTFALDVLGQLWYEDASAPGVFDLMCGPGGVAPTVINQPSLITLEANTRAYLFFSDLQGGTEQPRQWDGSLLSRVTKCGPGAAPSVGTPATATSYGASAFQFSQALNVTAVIWGTSASTTPSPGNNLYLLFAGNGNTTQFNVGDYVYLVGLPALGSGTSLNGTYQVASVGAFGSQEYIQIVVRESGSLMQSGLSGVTVQRTRATVVLATGQPSTPNAFTGGGLVLLNSFPQSVLNNQFNAGVPTLANLSISQVALTDNLGEWTGNLVSGNRFWWAASTQYNLGQQIVQNQSGANPGNVWVVIRQGLTGASAPAWPGSPTQGTTVADGTVLWGFVPNGRILLSVSNTGAGGGLFNVQQVPVGGASANGATGVVVQANLAGNNVAASAENGVATAGGGFSLEVEPAFWTLGHPELSPIFGTATGSVTGTGAGNQAALPPSQPPPGPQQVVALSAVPSSVTPAARNRVIASNPVARAYSLGAGQVLDPPAQPGTALPSVLNDVAPGSRWVVCLFLTKTGHITPASPPQQFSPIGGYVQFNNLPIGPPDTIARIIAWTQANAAVGGPYYYIPQDATLTSVTVDVPNIYGPQSNTASTATAQPNVGSITPVAIPATKISGSIVWDNVSGSSGVLTMSDTVLVSSVNISADGQNYLRTRELGECVGAAQYSGRNFYFGERAKVDNLVNPTFDGGFVGDANNGPVGWTPLNRVLASYSVVQSLLLPASCFALNITNSGAVPLNPDGISLAAMEALSQGAFQDAYGAPIVLPNTGYGVRVILAATAASGNLVVELYSPGLGQSWAFTQPLIASVVTEFTGVLNNPLWEVVPSDLLLRVYATDLPPGGSVVVERIEAFDVRQPVLTSRVAVSYANDPEGIDAVSGAIDISQWTSQPIRGVFRWLGNIVIGTDSFTFMVTDNGNTEPFGWAVTVASDQVGMLGPRSWCLGNEFVIVADRNGVYTFDGGNHVKMSQEIQQVWDSRYTPSQVGVWLENDLDNQRVYVGIPLVLPNAWLPAALADLTPANPNTILMCNYLNLMNGTELADGLAVSVSMFTGGLLFRDNKRKWCPWTIAASAAAFIRRDDGGFQFWLAADRAAKINMLGGSSDNGQPIPQVYLTYAFNDELVTQGLQWSDLHKIYVYLTANVEGNGKLVVTGFPDTLQSQWPIDMPGYQLSNPAQDDINLPLNMRANRMFLRFATDLAAGSNYRLESLVVAATADSKIPVSGR